ncbi:MAG TPA: hypothetical protein VGQ88_04905 [Burkholderiales bacterium]|nr:hypothetical protein [Burkholderiales bacterium]
MKSTIAALILLVAAGRAVAQPASTPALDYTPVAESFKLPLGANFGAVSGVAINSKGHIFVLSRGPQPVMEFDANGNYIRAC